MHEVTITPATKKIMYQPDAPAGEYLQTLAGASG